MSVNKKTADVVSVKVKKGEIVSLSVIIGNGHIGSSAVKFRFVSDVLGQGEIDNLLIGKAEDIEGKTLRVATRVLQANTNKKIILTHQFKNAVPAKFPYSDEMADSHDVFTQVADYKFQL